jgi:amidophosphoribosyltransferase
MAARGRFAGAAVRTGRMSHVIALHHRRPAAEADHAREACGVFGVHARGAAAVARLTYLGLFALQHRGQEAAGMAVSDGDTLTVVKDQGLVASVFDDRTLAGLAGHLAIGHCRYSTTGSSTWRNAQPAYRSVGEHMFALGHNGNLVNTEKLAAGAGMLEGTVTSDSDLVAELIAAELSIDVAAEQLADLGAPVTPAAEDGPQGRLERAVATVITRLEGAFSFVIMDEARVMGVRDPHGFRPLCLGRLDASGPGDSRHGGWVLASETPALDIVGATFVRELEPGEMVVIDDGGVRSLHPHGTGAADPRLCLFEFVYFARPDSRLYGQSMHQARIRMGEQLAGQAPVDADMVMGVPESGVPAAEGFARRSGIPLGQGLVKNRYIGRSFIAPSQEMRAEAVRMKLNPLRENVAGKRLVVVDDSIVRGTTQKQLVRMLREAGAREVHLRITSPPVVWSCFYGIDTGDREELIAAHLDVDGIREYLNLDTLAYLTLDRLVEATGAAGTGFCDACFTGDYPVPVPVTLRKHVLERDGRPRDRHVQPALDGTIA